MGISAAFENTAALTEKAVVPGVEQTNGYYGAKAEEGKSSKIGWEWMLVLGVFVGALVSHGSQATTPRKPSRRSGGGGSVAVRASGWSSRPGRWRDDVRSTVGPGTSGHWISGSMQLAASSWVFSAVFFAVATATAFALYGTEGANHV